MSRVALYVVGVIVAAALLAWGLWSFDPFGRRKHAEQKATVATQQVGVETAKTEAVERVIRSEVIIRQQAMEAQYVVAQAQGAEQPLSPAVADAVRAGVDGMRNPPAPSDSDRSDDASGAVR